MIKSKKEYLYYRNIEQGIKRGRDKGLISEKSIMLFRIYYIYGKIRPMIRKLYYFLSQ